MIKVSVVMPAYNVEDYIEKSIRSVMNQTLTDIELIVVNDASTDHTWDKICSLAEEYGEKIKGINLPQNVRQGGARNIGIKEASGEYIAFVDSDDWIEPDMLESFYYAINENHADLAGTCRFYMYHTDENIQEKIGDREMALQLSGQAATSEVREKYYLCPAAIWQSIFRKQIIIENDIWFPERVSYEDNYFYNLYLGYIKKYICIDKPFYYYRQNPNSTVHRKDYTQLHRIDVEKKLLEEYKRRGLYDDVKEGYDAACIRRWYINTMGLILQRLGKEAIKLASQMGKEFRSYFPSYKNNRYYLEHISKKDRIKLGLFEISPWLLYIMYKVVK